MASWSFHTAAAGLVALGLMLAGAAAHGQVVVEGFDQPGALADGQLIGACDQLMAHTAGGGVANINSAGRARLATPSASAVALLVSSTPLPLPPYTLWIELNQLDYFASAGATENGAVLAALSWVVPQGHTESWWRSQLAVAVWLQNEEAGGRDAHILYWDAQGTMHNWTAVGFAPASVDFSPAAALLPNRPYRIAIDRQASQFQITIHEGGKQLAQATLPASLARHGPHWFLCGDPFSTAYRGSLAVEAIALPKPLGCTLPPDAGPPADLGADAAGGDASAGDSASAPDAGFAPDGSVPPPDANRPPGDVGAPTADGGDVGNGPSTGPSGTTDLGFERIPPRRLPDCALSAAQEASETAGLLGLGLLLLALLALRRRR